MRPVKVVLVTLLAGGISIGMAIFGQQWIGEGPADDGPPDQGASLLETLPDFQLNDLDGREVRSSAWAGKTLILSFWATWCPPCLAELPMLVRYQEMLRGTGVQVVGVAVDKPEDVRRFLTEHPLNFPLLIATPEAIALSKRLGNRLEGLPYTVIFDQQGRRIFGKLGSVSEDELRTRLATLVALPDTGTPETP